MLGETALDFCTLRFRKGACAISLDHGSFAMASASPATAIAATTRRNVSSLTALADSLFNSTTAWSRSVFVAS